MLLPDVSWLHCWQGESMTAEEFAREWYAGGLSKNDPDFEMLVSWLASRINMHFVPRQANTNNVIQRELFPHTDPHVE